MQRGVRATHRPPLRAAARVQDRRRRHGVRLAWLRGGEHRGRLRLFARSAQCQGGIDPRQRHTPLPRGGGHQGIARQENRHHSRAHRRGHGRRQPVDPRHPHRAGQGAGSGQVRRRIAGHHAGGNPAYFPRQLRHRFTRLPAGAHTRRVRVCHRPNQAHRRQKRRGRRDLFHARHQPPVRSHLERHAVPTAKRRDRGAVPLDRRLGHDHHRQKSWRDHRQLWPDYFRAHPDL